ncbi:MAG: hypothetical protein NTZ27_12190 [Ignavibacteriales bacterium]|nr:hypothetical protein [Ignavibacteriales bacterium]
MKKYLVLVLVILLSGCGKEEPTPVTLEPSIKVELADDMKNANIALIDYSLSGLSGSARNENTIEILLDKKISNIWISIFDKDSRYLDKMKISYDRGGWGPQNYWDNQQIGELTPRSFLYHTTVFVSPSLIHKIVISLN